MVWRTIPPATSGRPFIPGRGWAENRLLESERQCAEFTVRFMTVMLARNVERLFIHSGSSGIANEGHFECCLFGYGGEPRKAFPALAVFTELMGPRPRRVAEKAFAGDGHCFAFETPKRSVLVVWLADEDAEADVTVPAGATAVRDFMGRKLTSRRVTLSTSPHYIVGPAGGAKDLLRFLRPRVKEAEEN